MSKAFDWQHANYEEARAQCASFTDLLGNGMDEGIIDTVTLLNLLGFRTFQSCEGHGEYGNAFPWIILIDAQARRPLDREWDEVCTLIDQVEQTQDHKDYERYAAAELLYRVHCAAVEQEAALAKRLNALLDDFYASTNTDERVYRLVVQHFQPGECRIAPSFTSCRKVPLPDGLKPAFLKRSQAEMAAFTAYLKERWLQARATTEQATHADPAPILT